MLRLFSSRGPRFWWIAGASVLGFTLLVTLATAPRWGGGYVQRKLVEAAEGRTGLPLTIGALDLEWGRARLREVTLGGGEGQLRVHLSEVVVSARIPWNLRPHVEIVTIVGGEVAGEVAQFLELGERVRGRRSQAEEPKPSTEGESAAPSRLPDRIRVADLRLDLRDTPRGAALRGSIRADLDAPENRASVMFSEVKASLGRGPELVASSLRIDLERQGGALAFPVRMHVVGAGAALAQELGVAGVDGWIEASDAHLTEVSLALQGGFADPGTASLQVAKLWSTRGSLRRDLSAGRVEVDMESFELGRVPAVLERLPLVESEGATVGGRLAVVFGDGVARAEGELDLAGLHVEHRTLARDVVRDVGFELAFASEVDPRASRLELVYAELVRNGVRVSAAGEVEHPQRREGRRYRVHAEVPSVPCAKVLGAIPEQLVPALLQFELAGKFQASVDADIDYARLEDLALDASLGMDGCRVKRTPPHAMPQRLAAGFTHRVQMRDGQEREVELFAGSSSFTPLEQISPYMVAAVLTTEDGGFWRHRGFLPSQFEVALRRNLSEDRIRLGASTITMQMVKNVLLSHERTLGRKLQEMFLTWFVETSLTKERILELYLNAIEYGPGIYGITDASRHYFGKPPLELTPPEAAYLALMLPSPVRRHVHYCRGELSPAFRVKLHRILSIMHERQRLSDLEYEVWKDAPLVFDLSNRVSERNCISRIETLSEGEYTQRAVSGLLGLLDPEQDRVAHVVRRDARAEEPWEDEEASPSEADAPGVPAMDADGEF